MWSSLQLKLEEASFFAGQLRSYTRHPRHFMFFLSAFLSSTRSLTFHVQKRIGGERAKVYQQLRDEMLADPIARFFIDMRNLVEKEGYPALNVTQLYGHEKPEIGTMCWSQMAAVRIEAGNFERLESLLREDIEYIRSSTPVRLEYRWEFPDFPENNKSVVDVCDNFVNRLWFFVRKLHQVLPAPD